MLLLADAVGFGKIPPAAARQPAAARSIETGASTPAARRRRHTGSRAWVRLWL